MLKKMLWRKRDQATREWRRLHNKELYDVYWSPHFIRAIKSRRMRGAGHVTRTGNGRSAYRVLVRTPEGKARNFLTN
jgi:hypothetical protein